MDAYAPEDLAKKSQVMSNKNKETNTSRVGGGAAGRQLAAGSRHDLTNSTMPYIE